MIAGSLVKVDLAGQALVNIWPSHPAQGQKQSARGASKLLHNRVQDVIGLTEAVHEEVIHAVHCVKLQPLGKQLVGIVEGLFLSSFASLLSLLQDGA